MSDTWNDLASEWDSDPSVIRYTSMSYPSLVDAVNLSGLRVLDFGCGTGLLSEKIAQVAASVLAIDPASKMIDVLNAKQLPNVETVCGIVDTGFVEQCQAQGKAFDLIVASSSLGFVPDYPHTLRDLTALLAQGGKIVQWDWLKENPDDYGFTEAEIRQAFSQAKLSLLSLTQPFSLDEMKVIMAVGQRPAE